MTGEQLHAWHQKFHTGDEVHHRGNRRWGKVIEVKPTWYGVELLVECGDVASRWWEGARIDQHRPWGRRARLANLLEAMRGVALRHRLGSASLGIYQGDLDLIEGYAHELAHRVEAGPGFERVIEAASLDRADQHEAAALRIEVAALSALGVRVSLRRLWRVANWNGEAPTFRGLLNARERACARRMANLVKHRVADC